MRPLSVIKTIPIVPDSEKITNGLVVSKSKK